jgi:chloramphenicol-sensitive protein RarD
MTSLAAPRAAEARGAVVAGVTCYVIWGLLPIYLAAVARTGASPYEIVAQRAIWAVPCAGVLVLAAGQRGHALEVLRSPRTLAWLSASALLVGANWMLFIVAVTSGRALEGSLGYFITPLMNMALGAVVFRERLDAMAKTAVAFAAAGVAARTAAIGHLPLIALGLGGTFAAYGLIRRQVAAEAQTGLFVECLILIAPGAAYVAWLQATGAGHFLASPAATALLPLGGAITVGALALFAWAARRLPLSSLAFLQFIAPSLQFIYGLVTGERLSALGLAAFALIWIGAALFALGAWRAARRSRLPG